MSPLRIKNLIILCLKDGMNEEEITELVTELRPRPFKENLRWVNFLSESESGFRHELPNCECWKYVRKHNYFVKAVTENHPHKKYVKSCELCFKERVEKETSAIICPHCKSGVIVFSIHANDPEHNGNNELRCTNCSTHWGRNSHW